MPADAALFETPESKHLFALQSEGEFVWQVVDGRCQVTDEHGNLIALIDGTHMSSLDFEFRVEQLDESGQ